MEDVFRDDVDLEHSILSTMYFALMMLFIVPILLFACAIQLINDRRNRDYENSGRNIKTMLDGICTQAISCFVLQSRGVVNGS